MKRKETIDLENALIKHTLDKRIYGCEEITIGFFHSGLGNEVVDFMTMDSKGVVKCYEIKVTLQDLKSKCKKSWYGHYNYLVVTKDLYDKVDDWDAYIPKEIGILVVTSLNSERKAKRQDINIETELMLKESMIRSMYWKMQTYKDTQSLEKTKELKRVIRNLQNEKQECKQRATKYAKIIDTYETYRSFNEGEDISLAKLAKEEEEKFMRRKDDGK